MQIARPSGSRDASLLQCPSRRSPARQSHPHPGIYRPSPPLSPGLYPMPVLLGTFPSKPGSEECTTITSRMANTTAGGSFRTQETDSRGFLGSRQVFPLDRVPTLVQEGNLLVPCPDKPGTRRYPTRMRQTQNSVTEYVADASTAKRLRLRRGVALCSAPGNWWVTETMSLSTK